MVTKRIELPMGNSLKLAVTSLRLLLFLFLFVLDRLNLMEIYRKNLIISADDFGANEKANENILQLIRLGKIDRVSVMMDGSWKEEETQELLGSGIKLDIHLHTGNPDDWNRKSSKRDHLFLRVGKFLKDYFSNNLDRRKVYKDWEAQILKFKETFGKVPDGLNSHEHFHFFPPYFRLAIRLYKKYEIKYFRFGKSGVVKHKSVGGLVALILRQLWTLDRKHFRRNLAPSSDLLLSFDWIRNPEEFLGGISRRVLVEVVFHPERDEEYGFLLQSI
jgi:predicted glycoside hydrolase/deacetylase ChbG (UPF0249 family)